MQYFDLSVKISLFAMCCWIGVGDKSVFGDEPEVNNSSAKRGLFALQTRVFNPATMSKSTYDNLWKAWGMSKRPDNYPELVRKRYGLPKAPFANDDYPLGLRKGSFYGFHGVSTDCMSCHGGSLFGKSYIGLGNTTMDLRAYFDDMVKVDGQKKLEFASTRVRGTVEAVAMTEYLFSYRNEDLSVRFIPRKVTLSDNLSQDVTAWWLLKKKKTMYHTGSHKAQSVRALMQFMLHPFNSAATIKHEEPTFRDIRAYLVSLEAPKYPFAKDEKLAAKGKVLFENHCSRCHGTYGKNWTYPNRIVPLEEIGTDPARANCETKEGLAFYNKTWFGEKHKSRITGGYQAPPLDGIWATAPYFHNGSVPTVAGVLNSRDRPALYKRSFGTEEKDYDKNRLGWKFERITKQNRPNGINFEQRKIYDTSKPGRSNQGHTYGDKLTPAQRRAVIEYLKTL